MPLNKTWRSLLTPVPVALFFTAIALVLTWNLVGVGQNAQDIQNVQTPGTPQVTIPYPTWGDGTTQPDHMVPGQPWESAYQPDKWPSQRQRAYVKQLEDYHPDLYATWGKRLNQALTNKKLDRRSEMLIAAALSSLVHWARPVVEYYVDLAFEAGSNTSEIMSAIESVVDVSGHSENDGFMALWYVVHTREQAGKATPLKGAPFTEQDLIPPSGWTPVKFRYQSLNPRPDGLARREFEPVLDKIEELQREERRKLQPGYSGGLTAGVSGRMSELLFIAGDTAVVHWPAPLLDQHHHEALNRGSNLQEIVEVMMVAAELVQGAGDSNVAGIQRPTGLDIMVHGLQALSRVVAEREKAEYKTPGEYGEGFTKKVY
jgi:alkylhydroperoxidase/carboxymuconolactone decarboxylase family protein YurZ